MTVGGRLEKTSEMSHLHGSTRIRCGSLLKESVDRVLMHTGLKEILELREYLIHKKPAVYLNGTLFYSLLSESAEFLEFDIIQIL